MFQKVPFKKNSGFFLLSSRCEEVQVQPKPGLFQRDTETPGLEFKELGGGLPSDGRLGFSLTLPVILFSKLGKQIPPEDRLLQEAAGPGCRREAGPEGRGRPQRGLEVLGSRKSPNSSSLPSPA